jgi:hypothetical protein
MKYGYARVSSASQDHTGQVELPPADHRREGERQVG